MECLNPIYLVDRDMEVPCGKCGFCCATKRSDWAFRLEFEHKQHMDSSFVTLTYANNELTFVDGVSQLVVEDLQKFFKRVRKAGCKFRYYAVGEYGSHTYRPHYHVIFFGNVPELVIKKAWGLGLIHYGMVTSASVAYCCKYLINSKAAFMRTGRIPPFSTQSRKRPDGEPGPGGLGYNYLSPEMIAWHKSDSKTYVMRGSVKVHMPRYYRDRIFTKRERMFLNKRDQLQSIESLRKELKRLGKYHPNPMEYREQSRRVMSRRIKHKGAEKTII